VRSNLILTLGLTEDFFLSFFLSFQSSFYLPLTHVTDSHLD